MARPAEAVEAIRRASQASDDLNSELLALLLAFTWRPHLIAATTVALGYGDDQILNKVWERFDRGSWVTPQLGVATYLRDSDFETEARHRIEFWSNSSERRGDPKALSALIGLCTLQPGSYAWMHAVVDHTDVQQTMPQDGRDRGDRIARGWLERIRVFRDAL